MKTKKPQIVPTVMPTDQKDFLEKIDKVFHFVGTIQIDVMDGRFVPSKSWPYNSPGDDLWESLVNQDKGLPYWEDINYEVDLMVENQIEEAKNWISAGVMRVICHIEALKESDKEDFINLKKEFGVELSLALVPETPLSELDPYLEHLDSVQFMGINKIGYQGQAFEPKVLDKIKEFHEKNPEITISIDGGVSYETAADLFDAGATRLASGSTIFNAVNPKEVIDELKAMAN